MCEALVREWQGGVSSSTHDVPWRQEVNHARLSKHRRLLFTAFSIVYLSVCACCLFWWCKTALWGWKEWQTCPAIAMTRMLCQGWAAGRRFPWLRSDPPGLVFSVRFCQTASNRLASFLYQHLCSSALCDGKIRRRGVVWTRGFWPFCDRFTGLFFLFSLLFLLAIILILSLCFWELHVLVCPLPPPPLLFRELHVLSIEHSESPALRVWRFITTSVTFWVRVVVCVAFPLRTLTI